MTKRKRTSCLFFFDRRILITLLVSFGHCVVCSSLRYEFWLPLWYLLAIVLYVLLWLTDSGYLLVSFDHCVRRTDNTMAKIYQKGNQNPYIKEEQTTQWPKEKGQKDKQRSTKHTHHFKHSHYFVPLRWWNLFKAIPIPSVKCEVIESTL
jgi:hypothetical protein